MTKKLRFDSWRGARDIRILNYILTGPGAQKASYSVVTDGFSPLVQRPKNEADHSPSFSAEIKNEWRSPPPVNMPSWNVQWQLRCTFQMMRCRSTKQLNLNRMHSAEQVQVYCIWLQPSIYWRLLSALMIVYKHLLLLLVPVPLYFSSRPPFCFCVQ